MAFSLDTDLRAHLDNHLASLVSAYVENKLKRFGLYRRTTIHTGITVAQRTFGDKIKCIDTLLRESGKLLVSKLPITAMSRDETYEIHLKDILITEWCNYGILVVDNGGTRHKEYYISAFLSVADVRTSIQKTYHKSRLEMYEELQNAVKIMPSANGRRLCCSRSDREELFRLNCFADHMNFMKDLFCLESGLDPRSYKKNEDGPYRFDPAYSHPDIRYAAFPAPYGPWEHLVMSLEFIISDETNCMRMVQQFYTNTTGKFDLLVSYLNSDPTRGKLISNIYHHPTMAVLELLRVAGPDINLLEVGAQTPGGSLCTIDFFFQEIGINLIATMTYFLQKMVLFGCTINGETSLKDFFYPESGMFRFKPGDGLSRCTRYVTDDLRAAFPCTFDGESTKFSVTSRRRFQIIALISKFFTSRKEDDSEMSSPLFDRHMDLRGSSLDFDPDAIPPAFNNKSGNSSTSASNANHEGSSFYRSSGNNNNNNNNSSSSSSSSHGTSNSNANTYSNFNRNTNIRDSSISGSDNRNISSECKAAVSVGNNTSASSSNVNGDNSSSSTGTGTNSSTTRTINSNALSERSPSSFPEGPPNITKKDTVRSAVPEFNADTNATQSSTDSTTFTNSTLFNSNNNNNSGSTVGSTSFNDTGSRRPPSERASERSNIALRQQCLPLSGFQEFPSSLPLPLPPPLPPLSTAYSTSSSSIGSSGIQESLQRRNDPDVRNSDVCLTNALDSSKFQTGQVAVPEPSNQRAIAVVLASIKDFGRPAPIQLNTLNDISVMSVECGAVGGVCEGGPTSGGRAPLSSVSLESPTEVFPVIYPREDEVNDTDPTREEKAESPILETKEESQNNKKRKFLIDSKSL